MNNKKIKVGIDLSTTKIGVAILIYGEKLEIKLFEWELLKYSYENMKENIDRLGWLCYKILNITKNKPMEVGIEVANFTNQFNQKFNHMLGQRFSFYAGVIQAGLQEYSTSIKMFNANEWFKFLEPNYPNLERYERKQLAIEFAEQHYKDGDITEDKADAFGIAYFLSDCLDTTDRKEQTNFYRASKRKATKSKAAAEIRRKKQICNKEIIIKKYNASVKPLTKPQQAVLERTIKELEELKKGGE